MLATETPQTWLMSHQLVQGALVRTPGRNPALTALGLRSRKNESCCSDHRNKSLYQVGDTDSGASILINPILLSVGEIMQPGNRGMISDISAPVMEGGGGRRRGMWLRRVQATMHQPAGLTLQHSLLPGTSFFSDFSLLLSFASYLNTSQQFSPPPLFSVTLFPPSVPKNADTSLLQIHKSHEKEIANNSASLYPSLHPTPSLQHFLPN